MIRFFPRVLLLTTVIVGGTSLAQSDGAAFSCTTAKGVVILTNHPNGDRCAKVASGTYGAAATHDAPVAPAPNSVPPVAAAKSGTSHPALASPPAVAQQPRNPVEARLALHREALIQQTADAYAAGHQAPGANRAVTRRYLMTNRAAYQQTVGVTP